MDAFSRAGRLLVVLLLLGSMNAPAVADTGAPTPDPASAQIADTTPSPSPAPASGSAAEDSFITSFRSTIKYSAAVRTNAPSAILARAPGALNFNDGDLNFNSVFNNFISSRFDLLSEFEIKKEHQYGIRVSAAAWYDFAYSSYNGNDSPATVNSISVPFNQFTRATQGVHEEGIDLLDAFAYGTTKLGHNGSMSLRAGQFGQLWGETLFFGANGIANGMAPIDIVKLESVPSSTFKEVIRPVPQAAVQFLLSPGLSVGAYYQFKWEKDRIPAAGSYFSPSDIYDNGGERLLLPPNPFLPPGAAFWRSADLYAKNGSQEGIEVRFTPPGVGIDFGFYAINYSEKIGQIYITPGVNVNPAVGELGIYNWVYPENIRSYGVSVAKASGTLTLGAEASLRSHAPLTSAVGTVLPGMVADNNTNPLYAVGNTFHANVSIINQFKPNFIAADSNLVAEVAYNRLLGITANPLALDPNSTRDGAAFRLLYTPTYHQIRPNVDLAIPVGIGMGLFGKPAAGGNLPGGGVGDAEIGLVVTSGSNYSASITYTRYLGPAGTLLDAQNQLSYQQTLADRNFISFSISKSF